MDRHLLILLAKSGWNIPLHDPQLGDIMHKYSNHFRVILGVNQKFQALKNKNPILWNFETNMMI